MHDGVENGFFGPGFERLQPLAFPGAALQANDHENDRKTQQSHHEAHKEPRDQPREAFCVVERWLLPVKLDGTRGPHLVDLARGEVSENRKCDHNLNSLLESEPLTPLRLAEHLESRDTSKATAEDDEKQ